MTNFNEIEHLQYEHDAFAENMKLKDQKVKRSMFKHDADGEPCAVCKKPMLTKQGITRVGSGEKMHDECWGDFFKLGVSEIAKKLSSTS